MYLGSLRTRCVYYAWYEFYPNPSITIGGFTVLPGDKISAEVSYSVGVFTTSITDGSQHFSTTGTVSGAARSSAEWIVERPALCNGHHCKLISLSNFGTVSLGRLYRDSQHNLCNDQGSDRRHLIIRLRQHPPRLFVLSSA